MFQFLRLFPNCMAIIVLWLYPLLGKIRKTQIFVSLLLVRLLWSAVEWMMYFELAGVQLQNGKDKTQTDFNLLKCVFVDKTIWRRDLCFSFMEIRALQVALASIDMLTGRSYRQLQTEVIPVPNLSSLMRWTKGQKHCSSPWARTYF